MKKIFFTPILFLFTSFYAKDIDSTISRCDAWQRHFTAIADLPDGNNLQIMIKRYLEDTIEMIDRKQKNIIALTNLRRSGEIFYRHDKYSRLQQEKAELYNLEKTLAEREKAIAHKNPVTAEFVKTVLNHNQNVLNREPDKETQTINLFKEYLACLCEHQIKQSSYQAMKL